MQTTAHSAKKFFNVSPGKSTADVGSGITYFMLLIYTMSFFLKLPERIPVLGALRFDFIIGSILVLIAFFKILSQNQNRGINEISSTLVFTAIVAYIILTLPFVRWPGTVLRFGLIDFFKSAVFYIFTIAFITDQKKLKTYVFLYFILLLFIVLEPLYLYIAHGRLGYVDYSMGGDGFFRLSGTTNKVGGNPNGLASVIAILMAFIFFYYRCCSSRLFRISLISLVPVLLYALVLTGSRSGLLATLTALMVCALKSKAKALYILLIFVIAAGAWTQLDGIHKQRYETLLDKDIEGRAGVDGRIEHIKRGLSLFAERPLTGFGIGTYREANFNMLGEDLTSHNLYVGALVELGLIGSALYFLFVIGIFKNIRMLKKASLPKAPGAKPLLVFADIVEAALIIQLVFSIFAGSPSYYIWFLLAGISVVSLRLSSLYAHDNAILAAKAVRFT